MIAAIHKAAKPSMQTLLLYDLNLHLIIRLASAPHARRPTIPFFKDISARHKTSTFESFAANVLRQLPFRSRSASPCPLPATAQHTPDFSPPPISTPFRHTNRNCFWGPCFITTHVTLGRTWDRLFCADIRRAPSLVSARLFACLSPRRRRLLRLMSACGHFEIVLVTYKQSRFGSSRFPRSEGQI